MPERISETTAHSQDFIDMIAAEQTYRSIEDPAKADDFWSNLLQYFADLDYSIPEISALVAEAGAIVDNFEHELEDMLVKGEE